MHSYKAVTPPAIFDDDNTITHGGNILFRHPGYEDKTNVLVVLFSPDKATVTDDQGTSITRQGLYAQFALDVCGIIAGNRWDGSLSESKHLTSTNKVEPNSVLMQTNYYFHLPTHDSVTPYPVVPNFRQWCFPHDNLPAAWSQIVPASLNRIIVPENVSPSNLSLELAKRDGSCRVTGCVEKTQTSHLVPRSEHDWWHQNDMVRYNDYARDHVDDPANTLLLRSDIHIAFNRAQLVFVPKKDLMVHVLQPSLEYQILYHNHETQSFRCSVPLLFARLAWAIFPIVDGFLLKRQPRRLLLIDNVEMDAEGFLSASQCAEYSTMNTRVIKRQKSNAQEANAAEANPAIGQEKITQCECLSKRRLSNSTNAAWGSQHSSSEISLSSSSKYPGNLKNSSGTDANTSLAQSWLAKERLRSDPNKQWEKDLKWAKRVARGDYVMSGDEAKRYLTIWEGAEFRDELKEEGAGIREP